MLGALSMLFAGCAVESGWVDVAAGPTMACGLRFDGVPVCWGRDYPQIGDDPAPGLPDTPDESLVSMSTNGFESVGLRADGSALGWPADWEVPRETFLAVEAGGWFHCGLIEDGTSRCWGRTGERGGLEWSESAEFVQIAVGGWTVCGRRTDGGVECATFDGFPVEEPPAGPFVDLAVSATISSRACGLRPGGEVVCWGAGLPQGVGDQMGGGWERIEMGGNSVCVVTGSGEAQCWIGLDEGGELLSPPAGVGFEQMEPGGSYACGLTTDRDILCWGEGDGAESSPQRPG